VTLGGQKILSPDTRQREEVGERGKRYSDGGRYGCARVKASAHERNPHLQTNAHAGRGIPIYVSPARAVAGSARTVALHSPASFTALLARQQAEAYSGLMG
jgi:hypothetical protein